MAIRLAYLVTHPIQYQAPLLRRIAQESDIDLTVFFCSDVSTREFKAPGFGTQVAWDVPLLEGYKHEFLPVVGNNDRLSFFRPFNYGLTRRLRQGRLDVLWIHGYMRWLSWVAMAWAKTAGVKVLLRDEATMISTHRGPAKLALKRFFMSGLKAACDGFLAIGTLNRDYYLHYGIENGRIFSVPYAVDNEYFRRQASAAQVARERLRESLGLQPGRPIILFASKMIPRKRAGDLLEAYIRMSPDGRSEPSPYLIFIGDGMQRRALEARAVQLNWTSVKFLGFKNQSELSRFYDLSDVFVLPSVDEPWGLVVNEVMNAGRAIIVSDRVGCGPDLVHDGQNGYVFPAGDIEALRQALSKVVSNPEMVAAMGRKSREIIDKWSFEEDMAGFRAATNFVLSLASRPGASEFAVSKQRPAR